MGFYNSLLAFCLLLSAILHFFFFQKTVLIRKIGFMSYTQCFLVPLHHCMSDHDISIKTPVSQWVRVNVCAFIVKQSSEFLEVQSHPPLQRSNSFADDVEMEAERDIFLLPVSHVSEWVSANTSDKHHIAYVPEREKNLSL